jgi:MFS superfamily sulfate permease-like transporter
MDSKEKQGIVSVSSGALLLIVSMIASAMFAEKIMYGEYLFTATSLSGLVLMFIGMRKIMQHTVSKRR